jgi:ABC-2 type transport system permease protein
LRGYIALAERSYRRALTYPFWIYSQLIGNLIRLALFLTVWSWLLRGDQDLGMALAYICVAFFMEAINFAQFPWALPEEIRSGNIALGLLKPLSQPLRLLFQQWGENVVHLMLVLPVYAVAFFFLPVSWPTPERLGWFLLTALLGHAVYMLTSLAASSIAFWTMRGNLVNALQWTGFSLLSGKIVPLWLMPDGLRKVSELLPFVAPFYVPAAAFSGQLAGTALYRAVGLQIVWLAVMGLVVHLIWTLATRKVVVQGG